MFTFRFHISIFLFLIMWKFKDFLRIFSQSKFFVYLSSIVFWLPNFPWIYIFLSSDAFHKHCFQLNEFLYRFSCLEIRERTTTWSLTILWRKKGNLLRKRAENKNWEIFHNSKSLQNNKEVERRRFKKIWKLLKLAMKAHFFSLFLYLKFSFHNFITFTIFIT